jgi:DsbC/DsbD-like thiol-disulfide interchange protein
VEIEVSHPFARKKAKGWGTQTVLQFTRAGSVRGFALAALALAAVAASAQFVSSGPRNRAAARPDPVQYLFPEQVALPAGKPSPVALHFRIAPGLHINSHTPGDDFLIPTVFSIPGGEGARLESASYPAGVNITLPADPKTKLNVYTGEFVIQTRLVAAPGNHLVQGKLRYQACDQSQCMPPKTITVPIDVIGK